MSSTQVTHILFVGRPTIDKGLPDLLDALAILKRRDCTISVVGDTPLTAVPNHATPLIFHGRLSNTQVAKLMRRHDIVVVPSRYETFGNVALEAMASGCIVLASRTGGLQDVIHDGRTGYLFAAGDPADIARVLQRVLRRRSAARAVAQRAAQEAKRHDWEEIVGRTATLLSSIAESFENECYE